jgi:hypothetical protein
LTGSATHVPVIVIDQETFVDFNADIASRVLELVADESQDEMQGEARASQRDCGQNRTNIEEDPIN